jgi:hypothetical protein
VSVVEVPQLTEAEVRALAPEEVERAYREGRLARLLGREVPVRLQDDPPAGQRSETA